MFIFNPIKKIKIFLLFSFVANIFFAQTSVDLNFKNIEAESIGVKAIYFGIYSKKFNFMWLSTSEGLGTYNGYYYRKMVNPLDSNNNVLSKPITALYEDDDGMLWFGYLDSMGFSNFDYLNKKFTHFKPTEANKDVFAREFQPSQFYQDSEKRIWIATWGGGLLQYNKITKKFKCYNTETKFANNTKIIGGTVRTILEFEKNKFLICFFQESPAAYPCILDVEKNTLTEFQFDPYAKNLSPQGLWMLKRFSTIIHTTYYDKADQKLWLGGYSCVICVDFKNKVSKRISPREFKQEDQINLDNVTDFEEGNDGNIWASTTNSGIMVINKKTLKAGYHKQNGNCASCIADNSITNFTKDKDDNIWVFSGGRGASINTPYSQAVKIKSWNEFDVDYTNQSHQTIPIVQMLAKANHKLYISSANGISIYDYKNDTLYANIKVGHSTYENSIQSFKFAKNNKIELGRNTKKIGYNSLFAIYNESTGQIEDEKTQKHIYGVNFINDSLDATYAFSKYYTDMFKYNYSTKSFDTFFIFPKEKAPFPNHGIKLKRNKFLFLKDNLKGLVLLDAERKKVTVFKSNNGDKYFADSVIYSMHYNNRNSVWLGTNNGLYEFNINTESFINHSKELNLKNIAIFNVFEDQSGIVWFTSGSELCRYEPSTKKIMYFGKKIGFTNFYFHIIDYKINTTYDGDYYFLANKKGLTFFNTKELKLPSEKPFVSVFELLVNDTLFNFESNEVKLKHNQNNLVFRLISNQLYTSAAGSFSYTLLGLDEKIKALKANEIELQNLPSGKYELKIFYKNAFGIESENFSFSIEIQNPFWKTWWFIAFVVIIAGIILYIGIKHREKSLLKRQEFLENIVKERTEELVERANEIGHQKLIIEEKQKEIVDSILYARRIQNALLASKTLLNKYLKNYFIYFNPKELVSGDFYWATELKNKFYLVIGDSTGHGIPGAFMSLLNINFLNEAINEKGIEKTNDILNYVRNKLILSLADDGSEEGGKDGMDCSLLCFDFEKMELEFSCANNPIIIISNGQLTEYKADRMPVGKSPKDLIPFSITKLNLKPDDTIYVLTDGFADQFGGPTGKKLKHKNLREHLLKISSEKMIEQQLLLSKEFDEWKGNLEQIDDVCIIGVKI